MAVCFADPAAPGDGAWCEECWRAWQPELFENGAALAGTSPPPAATAAADRSPLGSQEKPSAPVMVDFGRAVTWRELLLYVMFRDAGNAPPGLSTTGVLTSAQSLAAYNKMDPLPSLVVLERQLHTMHTLEQVAISMGGEGLRVVLLPSGEEEARNLVMSLVSRALATVS